MPAPAFVIELDKVIFPLDLMLLVIVRVPAHVLKFKALQTALTFTVQSGDVISNVATCPSLDKGTTPKLQLVDVPQFELVAPVNKLTAMIIINY
jgi:hypothetical protein